MNKIYSRHVNIVLLFFITLSVSLNMYATDYTIPYMPKSIKSGDFDGDGFKDLVVGHGRYGPNTNETEAQISFLWNDGTGNFCLVENKIFFGAAILIAFAQLDNTGGDDIAVLYINGNNSYMRIFYNGDFSQAYDYLLSFDDIQYGGGGFDSDVGDINGDGDLDIIINSGGSHHWCYVQNLGNRQFAEPIWYNTPPAPYGFVEIACADFNEDGLCDLATLGINSFIYYSNGTSFDEYQFAGPIYNSSMVVADMNQDGHFDVVISGLEAGLTNHFRIYENHPGHALILHDQIISNIGFSPYVCGDINGDSFPDFLMVSSPFNFWILRNSGNWILDPHNAMIDYYGDGMIVGCLGDFDSNGSLDFAYIHYDITANNFTVLFNDDTGQFLPDSPTSNQDNTAIAETKLIQCYPNPCRDGITIKNISVKTSAWQIDIYNLKGQLVKSAITNQESYFWDLRDNNSHPISSGLYFLVKNNSRENAIKFIVLPN